MAELKSVSNGAEAEVAPLAPEKRQVLSVDGGGAVGNTGDQRRLVAGAAAPLRAGGAGPLSVIGLDERTRIFTTDVPPYVLVCALDITAPWGSFVGTGWFIGKRTIITAGHCVYHRTSMGGWATSIRVIPGANGDAEPNGGLASSKFSTTETWLADMNPDHDVAAIHLSQDFLPPGVAPFRVATLPDAALEGHSINVSGYPGDKGGREQWWARNRIRAVRPRRIYYDVDTMGGQSGGPAFLLDAAGGAPTVVAIHAYGTGGTPADLPMEVNSAPRITADVLALFKQWVDQDTPGAAVLT
ncbi:trypsin-like peptidase domain-containing protein [uncultured Phenylobacterium sp.]|uniref:trypsin-like serine peptidase n=1 Tax=uncultured Phenylobacterium sp. TaxID=349273 RepID=UPI0025EC4FEE|nr:trypsin-like peptidase domain-containing protein [uncultured Phenylobacterium sp.]